VGHFSRPRSFRGILAFKVYRYINLGVVISGFIIFVLISSTSDLGIRRLAWFVSSSLNK
jgi:hypothetical protein